MIEPVRARGVFAMVTREEVWTVSTSHELREERLSHGRAEFRDDEIVAADDLDEELLAVVERGIERSRQSLTAIAEPVVARLIVSARRAGSRPALTESVMILSRGERSIVSSPERATTDLALLSEEEPGAVAIDYRGSCLVWRNGSGAVLMHEAAGHAAEHVAETIVWPAWLSVRDEPVAAYDDTGAETRMADLLRGESPASARCSSFSSVPLRRMANIVVRQDGAPFAIPEERIEIDVVGGGAYDPLTDTVRLLVAGAMLVTGDTRKSVQPFVIEEPRSSVAFALRGAAGDPQRYPGVICSSEGQELAVGSHAPLLVTEF